MKWMNKIRKNKNKIPIRSKVYKTLKIKKN